MSSLITQRLIAFARNEFALDWEGIHGAPHWSRVRHNGLLLAEHTGANIRVVEYFAFIHDLGRWNDHHDPEHGNRAAAIAENIAGDLIELAEDELALLTEACRGHSDGHTLADVTVMTCWDADRLEAEIRESQLVRLTVWHALREGKWYPWDYQPLRDASEQYMRNHKDLNVLEKTSRYPSPSMPEKKSG